MCCWPFHDAYLEEPPKKKEKEKEKEEKRYIMTEPGDVFYPGVSFPTSSPCLHALSQPSPPLTFALHQRRRVFRPVIPSSNRRHLDIYVLHILHFNTRRRHELLQLQAASCRSTYSATTTSTSGHIFICSGNVHTDYFLLNYLIWFRVVSYRHISSLLTLTYMILST